MAKKDKQQEFVTQITPRSEDFSKWYTDVILQHRHGGLRPRARLHGHQALRLRRVGTDPEGL